MIDKELLAKGMQRVQSKARENGLLVALSHVLQKSPKEVKKKAYTIIEDVC